MPLIHFLWLMGNYPTSGHTTQLTKTWFLFQKSSLITSLIMAPFCSQVEVPVNQPCLSYWPHFYYPYHKILPPTISMTTHWNCPWALKEPFLNPSLLGRSFFLPVPHLDLTIRMIMIQWSDWLETPKTNFFLLSLTKWHLMPIFVLGWMILISFSPTVSFLSALKSQCRGSKII